MAEHNDLSSSSENIPKKKRKVEELQSNEDGGDPENCSIANHGEMPEIPSSPADPKSPDDLPKSPDDLPKYDIVLNKEFGFLGSAIIFNFVKFPPRKDGSCQNRLGSNADVF